MREPGSRECGEPAQVDAAQPGGPQDTTAQKTQTYSGKDGQSGWFPHSGAAGPAYSTQTAHPSREKPVSSGLFVPGLFMSPSAADEVLDFGTRGPALVLKTPNLRERAQQGNSYRVLGFET